MFKVLVIDSSAEDAEWLRGLFEEEGAQAIVCRDGTEARPILEDRAGGFAMVFILWDGADPAFAETLALLRHRWPETIVVVILEEFTYELAMRAMRLGARNVLQKPLDAERVIACYRELPPQEDSELMASLRGRIHGKSGSLMAALRQLEMVIPDANLNVLLLGESGTGKELFARAIHDFGPRSLAPFVAVQVSAIPKELFESHMFGHEKGAFTSADKQRIGYLEQAGNGTLFLDELGDLEVSKQVTLLRAIEEKRFRRLGGNEDLFINARLVFATHHDLPKKSGRNEFRNDLYQRINKIVIYVPPLRERKGDVELLARHFLNKYKGEREADFAAETLKILSGYPFPGNVRQLENIVEQALATCKGKIILPQHLPMRDMHAQLPDPPVAGEATGAPRRDHIEELIDELARSLPDNWLALTHKEAFNLCKQAFDRVYLRNMYERHGYNVTEATKMAGLDPKTFRNKWNESGLPSLREWKKKPTDETG